MAIAPGVAVFGMTEAPGDAVAVRTWALTKQYGSTVALDHLDLEVRRGEVLGYLGPNGAGKSTTIGLLLGLIRPSEGRAEIFGVDPWRDGRAAHRLLAYVPSEANLWPSLTGRETLDLLASVHGSVDRDYRTELIERFELALDKRARDYSHGNRQKVLLIAALAARPDLLLLDEPTTGLDPLMEQVFHACIREARDRGQTVLLSSHVLSEVEALSDRVAMLRAGRLIEVGDLEVLRHVAGTRVAATFDGPPPDLAGVAGVSHLEAGPTSISCHVAGSMAPLITALAAGGAIKVTTRDPSLEEIFIAHYGPSTSDGTP